MFVYIMCFRVHSMMAIDYVYPSTTDHRCTSRLVTQDDRKWFLEAPIASERFKGFAWLLSPGPAPVTLPTPAIEDIILSLEYAATGDRVAHIQVVWTPKQSLMKVIPADPVWRSKISCLFKFFKNC